MPAGARLSFPGYVLGAAIDDVKFLSGAGQSIPDGTKENRGGTKKGSRVT